MLRVKSKTLLVLLFGISIPAVMIMFFAQPFRISGDCMEPAFKDGKLYFLNTAPRYMTQNQYLIGDVILFRHKNKVWISRIVALEKDTIKINNNILVINDTPLKDKIIRNWTDWQYGNYAIDDTFRVPQGHIYVLSDNLSAHHDDSRVFGAIPKSEILGRLW